MKKILSLLLALALVFSVAGCQVSENVNTSTTAPESTAPETTVVDVIIEDVTEPETTEPEVTEPETTLPPQTDPPKTEPVETLPLQTDPPVDHTQETEPPTEPEVTEPATTLPPQTDPPQTDPPAPYLDPNGSYTTKDDVALYIYLYGRLPNNFITKQQAENYSGELCDYGLCIGGNRFYNREGLLPQGYTYYECDIGTLYSTSRGAKRLVFTYSGLIYYTSDHYRSFTLLYGNP